MRKLLIFILLLNLQKISAQRLNFRNYQTDEGLPSNEVYDLMQDSKGYIWGATDAGVFRFNGKEFKIFSTNEGLPDNTIFHLFEDRKGRIWVSGFNGKVGYYENNRFHQIAANPELSNLLSKSGRIIMDIKLDSHDNLYLGTYRMPYKITPENHYKHIREIKDQADVLSLHKEIDNHIFLTSHHDIYFPNKKLIEEKKEYYLFNAHIRSRDFDTTLKISVTKGTTFSPKAHCLRLSNNTFAYAYINNLCLLEKGKPLKKYEFQNGIVKMVEDSEKNLWIGFYNQGLRRYEKLNLDGKFKTYLQGQTVTDIMRDHEGGLWISTHRQGIFYTQNLDLYDYGNIEELSDKIIGMRYLDSMVYVVTAKNIIYAIRPNGEAIKKAYYQGVIETNTGALYEHQGKRYFAGFLVGETSQDFSKLKTNIRGKSKLSGKEILFNEDGSFLVISTPSICKIVNNEIQENYNNPYPGETITRTSDGRILVGTIGGLFEFRNGEYISLIGQHPLLESRINRINTENDGKTYCCTRGAGLLILHGNQWEQIGVMDGLPSGICYDVRLADNGDLWLATSAGLCRIQRTGGEKKYIIEIFDRNQGLISNEVNHIILRNHEIWMGSKRGIQVFKYQEETVRAKPTPIHFEAKMNDKKISSNHEYRYDENFFSVHLDLLSYKNPSGSEYLYRLSGLDSTWGKTKSRELEFRNLKPGKYALLIQPIIQNQQAEILSLYRFTIQQPWWQTWWSITIGSILVFLILRFVIRWRLRILRLREAKQHLFEKKISEYQLTAFRAQMNPHFLFNSINSIQRYVLQKEKFEAYEYLTKFSRLIRQVLHNSGENFITLSNELHTLSLYIEFELIRFEHSFDYISKIEPDIDCGNIKIPSMILQPIIENAIWHGIMPLEGTRRGKITLKIQREDKHILICIEDNGIGREQSKRIEKITKGKSMGISLTERRLELLRPRNDESDMLKIIDLYDEQRKPSGTRVELHIPITHAFN